MSWLKAHWQRIITAASVGFVIAVILIALFDRRPAVKVSQHHFIYPSPASPGELVRAPAGSEVRVEWVVEDLRRGWDGRSCAGRVYIIWVDSEGRRHPPQPDRTIRVPVHDIIGGEQSFTAWRTVPSDMPLGDAVYTVYVDRGCNSLQLELAPMREKLPDVKFKVVERP